MKIGKVTLTETWYSGKDLYSDGQVEDEMLQIARQIPEPDLNREIAIRGSWPVLYHFSHVRENILRWLPLDKSCQVLEIGAGCGAVTGALLRYAGQVDAVELSMKRSQINAYRHKEAENLRIYVGNFEEIEKNLDSSYDMVTLIGVFEYAQGYLHSQDPYQELLRKAASHLRPGGRIVLAIENRFGLKYWAGCTEDHTGQLFEGLEGYREGKGVCTFTRAQLKKMVEECGLRASWYYPYPDYKFPQVIHSDQRLPSKGELSSRNVNFDRLRLRLFDEAAVMDSIVESGLYPEFANSFLLVLKKEEERELPVYIKFSNERNPRYALMTSIDPAGEGGWSVRKEAMDDAACRHVEEIAENAEPLQRIFERGGFIANRLLDKETRTQTAVRLEYLSGITLEEKLDEAVMAGEGRRAVELLLRYAQRIREMYSMIPFMPSAGFAEMFGEPELMDDLMAAVPCDVDLVPANILQTQDGEFILDTEWTFDFPVPADYVVYRFLWYYLKTDPKRMVIPSDQVFEKAGIPKERMEIFGQMESRFQAALTRDFVPMREMYDAISPGEADVSGYFQMIRAFRERRMLQVFYDKGEGFREEDSALFSMDKGVIRIPVPEGTASVRLDPGEEPGIFYIQAAWADTAEAPFTANGYDMGGGKFFFLERDPQLVFDGIPQGAGELLLTIRVPKKEKEYVDFAAWLPVHERESREKAREKAREQDARITALENHCAELSGQLADSRSLIREMESTKAWRLYQRLRRILRG